jgi:hypothetical protein
MLLHKIHNTTDCGILYVGIRSKSVATAMHVKAAGRGIMRGISHFQSLLKDLFPIHLGGVVFQGHGMADDLEPVADATVMLAVDMIAGSIGDVAQLFSVLVDFAALVDLQLYAHVEIVLRTVEDRFGLVVVRVDRTLLELLIAAFAIRVVRIVIVIGIVIGDQAAAIFAGCVSVLIATGAEGVMAISLGIVPTNACGTAIAKDGQIVQTVFTIDVPLKFVSVFLGQFCSALRADVDGLLDNFLVLFVGVFVHGIILLKNKCFILVLTKRIIYQQNNKVCEG